MFFNDDRALPDTVKIILTIFIYLLLIIATVLVIAHY